MSAQIFISYRREGGDVTAKLICEALKNRGYTVFFDFDALKGGPFDTTLINAIRACNDFVLVLPPRGLDRCENEQDWVRQEIYHALQAGKNIIPILLGDFEFPETLPDGIDAIRRYNGVRFLMDYFDAVIDKICERLVSKPSGAKQQNTGTAAPFFGCLTVKRPIQWSGMVRNIKIRIDGKEVGTVASGGSSIFNLPQGSHTVQFTMDWLKTEIAVDIRPDRPAPILEVFFKMSFTNSLSVRQLQ